MFWEHDNISKTSLSYEDLGESFLNVRDKRSLDLEHGRNKENCENTRRIQRRFGLRIFFFPLISTHN